MFISDQTAWVEARVALSSNLSSRNFQVLFKGWASSDKREPRDSMLWGWDSSVGIGYSVVLPTAVRWRKVLTNNKQKYKTYMHLPLIWQLLALCTGIQRELRRQRELFPDQAHHKHLRYMVTMSSAASPSVSHSMCLYTKSRDWSDRAESPAFQILSLLLWVSVVMGSRDEAVEAPWRYHPTLGSAPFSACVAETGEMLGRLCPAPNVLLHSVLGPREGNPVYRLASQSNSLSPNLVMRSN